MTADKPWAEMGKKCWARWDRKKFTQKSLGRKSVKKWITAGL